MDLPLVALDPNNKTVSVLVDVNGRVVVDTAPKPATTYPATIRSVRVDSSGNMLTT